ncbi:MAG TPA: LytTR family DNA-binding domain-containing protein [Flavitalea sp.]|nr:LytTR family DNA-binding domain-containing protein [Flavitalea sp.]
MLRCIAIDDEELALELLEDNIRKVPYLELIATCSNPLEAIKVLQEEQIDLVFLDIQMPGITGIQFIRSTPAQCMFILVTAYEKYALEGFNLNVIDYLVKPVEFDRFLKACNKASELHQLRQKIKTGTEPQTSDFFFVNVEYSLVKIFKSDILYIEGLKDYVKIHLKPPSKPVVTRMSMKAMEEELPATQFIRIHKSYIISVAAVNSVRKTSVFIQQTELPISDNYRDPFFALIGRPS